MPDTQTIRSAEFTASRAWGALDIANMNGHHRAPALDGPALQMARQRRRGSICRDGRRSRYALPRKRRRTHRSVEKRRHLLCRNRHGTRRPSVWRSADFGDRERRQCLRSSEKKVSGGNRLEFQTTSDISDNQAV